MRRLNNFYLVAVGLFAGALLLSDCSRSRDYSVCNGQAPCQTGFVCTTDNRCVPTTDGGAGAGGMGGAAGSDGSVNSDGHGDVSRGCTATGCANPNATVCDTTTEACVQCLQKTDCTTTAKPACDMTANVCVQCLQNADCTGSAKPVCDMTAQACVQCLVSKTDCGGTTPICTTQVCGACKVDTDCVTALGADPGVCMPDGHCASASEVVYAIQPTTSSCTAADGSLAMPFCTAQAAVDVARVGTKPIVVLRGAFGNVSASATTGQVTVVGQSGAMINPGANIYGVDVSGTSNVYIRDLTISGGTSTSGAAAHVSGTAATLTLLSVQMNGNVGGGVVAEGGATIVMDRCVVTGTGFGAPADLKTTASAFKITNCVFANSSSGAVLDSPPPGGSEIFKNNDLLANGTGLQCLASFASGLILYGNTTDTGLGCTVAPCCTGNPMLTSDYHLMSGSPCIDQLTPDPQVPDDIDGQSRPYPVGGKSDCGADEYEP